MINWALGHFIIALFISVLDRYFSGEDYKKSEWINGKSFKFKLGVSLVIVMAPFFFGGFFTSAIFYTPASIIGLLLGFSTGEFFLRSYDWAFKKPAGAHCDTDDKTCPQRAADGGEARKAERGAAPEGDDGTRQSVVEAIQSAGSNIKEGLKSVGEGIAKASETVFGNAKNGSGAADEPREKKTYESNKKLDEKLNKY